LANEKTNRKNSKRHHNHKGRGDRYVEDFRWGFVYGEEPEDKPDVSEKKPVERKPPERKPQGQKPAENKKSTPPKTAPAASPSVAPPAAPAAPVKKNKKPPQQQKNVSRPAKPAVEDDDLNLPSYGRTPVPRPGEMLPDSSLPPSLPGKPVLPSKPLPEKTAKPRPQSTTQKSPPQKTPQKPERPFSYPQLAAFKEQMVWDAEKRDYVPLTVPKSTVKSTADNTVKGSTVKSTPPKRQPEPPQRTTQKTAPETKPPVKSPAKDVPEIVPPKNIPEKAVAKPVPKPTPVPPFKDEPKPVKKPETEYEKKRQQRRANVPPMSGVAITGEKLDAGNIEAEASGFIKLGVSDTMLEALKLLRYLEPTPIQSGVFERVKSGIDVMGQAQTGTGKTAAFCIPIIEAIEECPPGDDPVALILVPTRELAVQVRDEAAKLAYGREIRTTACYGGKPLAKQIERLKSGVDILVGTPGRILDLMNRRALFLDSLRWVVLDEADRMLDIGFRPSIEKILRRTPNNRQTLLFSATLAPPVVRLAEKYMNEPVVLDFSNKNIAVETIEQFYVTVDPQRKFDALVHLLNEQEPQQAIIFTRTKRGADRLARLLANRFENLAAIHGDLTQDVRDQVMAKFRSGKVRYLVATDVVGRGIDVTGISHIINYDVPAFCDDYVHRVGRTGRMGREGVAFTFVTVAEGSELTRIEMRINKLLKRAELKGFEAFQKPVALPEDSDDGDETAELTSPKPIFGKKVRKVRRAL